MKMLPKKVKYSSKHGVTVEWQRPDEMFLDSSDQVMVWLLLHNHLTWEEMSEHFNTEEQKTIEKYYLQLEKKEHVLIEQLKKKLSVKKLETELRCSMDWWKFCYEGGIKKIMAQIWGWKSFERETIPLLDQQILNMLNTDVQRSSERIKSMIASYLGDPKKSDPLPETIAKVEAVFGPLDWEALKEEGRKDYEKFKPASKD